MSEMPITAGRDVGALELEAVADLDVAPGRRQPVHGHGEVLAVEALGHLRVAEQHQAQQGQDLDQGGDQLAVEAPGASRAGARR